MLTFKFTGADGIMNVQEKLTSGMVGKQVKLEFTSEWDAFTKTAVFEAGDTSVAVYDVKDTVTIPAEVLATPLHWLRVGIYGEDDKGNIIPTIYAKGPKIEEGADPYRAAATDPPMPKWKEIEGKIGDLNDLKTRDKSSLVAAVNEALKSSGGAVDADEVERMVEEYLAENPPAAASVTINGEKPDANGNFIINTVSDVEIAQLAAALT